MKKIRKTVAAKRGPRVRGRAQAAAISRRRSPAQPASSRPDDAIRYFDLNMEKVLEAWDVSHAVRELIANALDEEVLSGTDPIDISRTGNGAWRIRDFGGLPPKFKELKISETMRPSTREGMNPAGLWEQSTGRVIVHRRELRSVEAFAGTLLHEFTHARTGHDDVSREFESALSGLIGSLAARALT